MISILIDDDMLLRSYQSEDATALFKAIDASRFHLRPWLNWVSFTTKPEHTFDFIQQSLQQLNNQEGAALGLFHKQQIIGGVGMHHWDHNLRKAQVGYWIAKEYEGKGLMIKCTQRFIGFLFEKLYINKVELHFVAANLRSAALAQKLGAKIEGVLRDSYIRNGQLEDLVIAGILKKDWKDSQKA